jgi:hypothetical protein
MGALMNLRQRCHQRAALLLPVAIFMREAEEERGRRGERAVGEPLENR